MSKSYDNTLPIFATGRDLKRRVMSIVTDSTPLDQPKVPEECTVYQLFALVASAEETSNMAARYRAGGYGFGHAKLELIDAIEARFADARARYEGLKKRPDEVEDALQFGAFRARQIAKEVLARAREACGVATPKSSEARNRFQSRSLTEAVAPLDAR